MLEIKTITSNNVSDLYALCTPPKEDYQKASRESADFFLEKQKANWQGLILYEGQTPAGRAEFQPLEESFQAVTGDDLYFMPCFWIKPEYEKKGYGRKLMEELLRLTGDRKGIATVTAQDWMPQDFFRKFGFEKIQEKGTAQLLLRKNQKDASCYWFEPSFALQNRKDRINMDVVYNHSCPYIVANWRNLIKKAKEVTDKLELNIYQQKDRKDLERYGEANIYIDGETPFYGPASEEEIEKIIREHLKKKGISN